MIDLNLLRKDPQGICTKLAKKDPQYDGKRLIELDEQTRTLSSLVESLRHKKNELADKAKGGVTPELREASIACGKELKEKEAALADLEGALRDHYLRAPNVPYDDIPEGGKESNAVVREWGSKPDKGQAPLNHVELGTQNKWFDFEAAARMTAGNFVLYHQEAVKLMYALTMFMLDHNQQHGFDLILPPYLVNEKSLEVASNFPKFRDQVYHVGADNLYLTPTSEVNIANLYRDHIFAKDELPVCYTAWTSCFRREAGSYGAVERGLIRIHQFEKVELYTFCTPENSAQELERMVACAEGILQKLGLTYRTMLLAGQDCSFPSAKTYDIEVWMPGQKSYYEVSSCSNCTDFQARRGAIRYRPELNAKTQLVHTLNGSSLALPRLMVALMETYAQPDGTIAIPDVLKGYGLYRK